MLPSYLYAQIRGQSTEPGDVLFDHLPLEIVGADRARGANAKPEGDLSAGRNGGGEIRAVEAPREIVTRIGRAEAMSRGVPGLRAGVFHRDGNRVELAEFHRRGHALRNELRRIHKCPSGRKAPALIGGEWVAGEIFDSCRTSPEGGRVRGAGEQTGGGLQRGLVSRRVVADDSDNGSCGSLPDEHEGAGGERRRIDSC